ncbi:hypothetical protein CSQ80_05875 [Cyanobacterium aponinum IPPAS B-1201]|uniref:Uncharacterized protein n=1 Tax=Cyanobacterium aponinum (strain PCC 10605) TaxID=755178 RepID=K9ZA07_CYAAP|nr:hypothetical protein Cyan10605_3383 [Cyanobacterium aponinum PCC 10605]PHV63266.1 hypothetical protein CSQ80_05875 [Cyanobacterium aponinum IPPAS B-1201]
MENKEKEIRLVSNENPQPFLLSVSQNQTLLSFADLQVYQTVEFSKIKRKQSARLALIYKG